MNELQNQYLNVALIGYAGKYFHAPLLINTPGLKLTTIVSSDSKKVLTDLPNVKVEADVQNVFSDPNIDLLVIAAPNTLHFELASGALQAGKNVVVDKPFTISSAEAEKLVELAQKSDRLISVFQNRRWDADFLTVQKILNEKCLGEIVYFESNYNRYRPQVQERWREQDLPGSGLWFDLGSHLVDQAVILFGAPNSVYGDLTAQRDGAKAIDYFHVVLSYGKRRVILHGSSLVLGDTPRFAIHGTKGSYIKHGVDTQEESMKMGEAPGCPNWGVDKQMGTLYTQTNGNLETKLIPNIPGNYLAYYQAIRDAILFTKPNPISGNQAITVMKILELVVKSAACGKTFKNLLTQSIAGCLIK